MVEFPTQPSLSSSPLQNKKVLIIGGIAAVFLVILVPFLVGVFSPSTTQQVTPTQTGKTPSSTKTPFQTANNNTSLTPAPSGGSTSKGTVKINSDYNKNPQTPTPEPTLDFDALLPTKAVTPTPTPLPGPFYVPNGQQNDLTLKLYLREDWDLTYEVQLINTRTREVRIIGYQSFAAPGDSMYFASNFSQVVFLGGSKNDYQRISIYSIPKNFVTKDYGLSDIKRALPALSVNQTSILSRMTLSPNQKKVAVSYGNTYNVSVIDPNTRIIVIDITTNKMQLLSVRGLMRSWKDDSTIEYEIPGAPGTVQEVKIN